MPCLLTSGRTEPCKDTQGGVKAAYFIDYIEDSFTVSAGQATAINVAITAVYKYELRADGNTFNESIVSDRNTGTTVNTQTTVLALKKQEAATSVEVDLMSKARPIIVVRDYNDNYKIAGIDEGNDLTGSDIATGGAKTDFNGYNLTFEATTGTVAPFLDAATITALEALVSGNNINP